MPEGDSLREIARQLSVLVGEHVAVEARNPRAEALAIAPKLDGERLDRVEALGKNLVLTFEGGLVLRSHLRMKGRWRVQPARRAVTGMPWLVIRGREHQAILWHGPVLELGRSGLVCLGPEIMASPPDLERMVAGMRKIAQETVIGEALLDQRLVAGIGNLWKAEGLFAAAVSPWARLSELSCDSLRGTLATTHRLMVAGRRKRWVYRRAGKPCPRCGASIRSRPQGEHARTAYWCPVCQPSVSH